jgi:hypothetical protein
LRLSDETFPRAADLMIELLSEAPGFNVVALKHGIRRFVNNFPR